MKKATWMTRMILLCLFDPIAPRLIRMLAKTTGFTGRRVFSHLVEIEAVEVLKTFTPALKLLPGVEVCMLTTVNLSEQQRSR